MTKYGMAPHPNLQIPNPRQSLLRAPMLPLSRSPVTSWMAKASSNGRNRSWCLYVAKGKMKFSPSYRLIQNQTTQNSGSGIPKTKWLGLGWLTPRRQRLARTSTYIVLPKTSEMWRPTLTHPETTHWNYSPLKPAYKNFVKETNLLWRILTASPVSGNNSISSKFMSGNVQMMGVLIRKLWTRNAFKFLSGLMCVEEFLAQSLYLAFRVFIGTGMRPIQVYSLFQLHNMN